MKQTENYQLNQWEKSDRIMMEDFNADNAKIDAALKAEETARIAALSAEITARQRAVNTLDSRITTEKNALSNTIQAEKAALQTAVGGRLAYVQGASISQTVNASAKFTVQTPGLHLEEYLLAVVRFTFPAVTGNWVMGFNGKPDGHCNIESVSGRSGLVNVSSNSTQSILLFPMKSAQQQPAGLLLGVMSMCVVSTKAGELSNLSFYPDGVGTFNGVFTVSVSGIK